MASEQAWACAGLKIWRCWVRNPEEPLGVRTVQGDIPACSQPADVTQLAECQSSKLDVAGSRPVVRSDSMRSLALVLPGES